MMGTSGALKSPSMTAEKGLKHDQKSHHKSFRLVPSPRSDPPTDETR